MLELKHLRWSLPDGAEIVRDVSVDIPDQKLVVVTGPNGGGKTTLARLIAGVQTPDSGQILLDGEDITGLDVTQRANKSWLRMKSWMILQCVSCWERSVCARRNIWTGKWTRLYPAAKASGWKLPRYWRDGQNYRCLTSRRRALICGAFQNW